VLDRLGGGAASPGVAALVLLVVLLVGVAAGRAKQRLTLLLAGLVALAVVGAVLTSLSQPAGLTSAAGMTALYGVALPLVVAFAAGWLAARGTWFRRLLVIAVAALLLAAFPYDVAGRATADALDPAASAGPPG
jgi:hypothetical protein